MSLCPGARDAIKLKPPLKIAFIAARAYRRELINMPPGDTRWVEALKVWKRSKHLCVSELVVIGRGHVSPEGAAERRPAGGMHPALVSVR
ncbi:unnamed protein product, partial [Iphiclides podalirius]